MAAALSYAGNVVALSPRRDARRPRRRHNEWLSWAAILRLAKRTQPGIKKDGVGPNVQLVVEDGNPGLWFRYTIKGRDRRHSLGSPHVYTGLADLQSKANRLARDLHDGIDPLEAKAARKAEAAANKAKQMTVAEVVALHLASKVAEQRSAKHVAQRRTSLEKLILPTLGNRPITTLTPTLVADTLREHYERIPETAHRTRGRLERVIDHAVALSLFQGENPARWAVLKNLLPNPRSVKALVHHAALPYTEIPTFMPLLHARTGTGARCVEFIVLTQIRSGVSRNLRWRAVDLAGAMLTVPKELDKVKKGYEVPLSSDALAVLRTMEPHGHSDDDLVFPGLKRGVPMTDVTLGHVLQRMSYGHITNHGHRSTFKDWASEQTDFPDIVVEKALGHTVSGKVEAAYRRGDLMEKRTRLMQSWADYCFGREWAKS